MKRSRSLSWAAPAKQREVGQRHFLQLAVDPFLYIYIYILKKEELILLRNDWLKEEHQIKINNCPARLEGSFIVLALSCRPSRSVSKRGRGGSMHGWRILKHKGKYSWVFQWAIQRFKTHSENHYWEAAFKHPARLFVTAFSVAAEACRRYYSPPSASHCFNGQHGNIVSRFKSSKLKREIISFNFLCTGDSDSPKPTRGKLHSNMWRHMQTACENEGTEKNQSESLAGSRVELLISYLESWYEKKNFFTGLK